MSTADPKLEASSFEMVAVAVEPHVPEEQAKMNTLFESEAPVTAHESVIATALPKPVSEVYEVREADAVEPHVLPESA